MVEAMDYPAERWTALREYVEARMAALNGMSQTALVEASKVSVATVRPLMKGVPANYTAAKKQKVSIALGWTPDSIDLILAGGKPIVAGTARLEAGPVLIAGAGDVQATGRVRAEVEELKAWRAAIDAWRAEVDQWRDGLSSPAGAAEAPPTDEDLQERAAAQGVGPAAPAVARRGRRASK